jgi:glycosyltransferase involved in cell wall biosynthesis
MKPDVSIIVPIYDAERFLEQCLASISAQTHTDIEIVCVDDGSNDSSLEIVMRHAAEDPRIKVVKKVHSGYGASVNQGIDASSGTYIGIVEADDWIDADMYHRLLDAAQRFDRPVDVVKAAYHRVIDADTAQEHEEPAFFLHQPKQADTPFRLEDDATFLYHHPSIWSAIYRRDFLDAHGIRFMPIPGASWADNPFMLETLLKAESIVYIDEALYHYREFNTGSSSDATDPRIYLDRWNDMADIIAREKVTSPAILEGHYNRACFYLDEIAQHHDLEAPALRPLVKRTLARMDYAFIYDAAQIEPAIKDHYQRLVGYPARLRAKLRRVFLSRPSDA